MSAIVMLFYWVLFPWVVYKVSKWLWRLMPNRFFKGIVIGVTIGIYAWFLWIAVGRNIWLDHQVRRMCAQDGGVKVYETVELSPEKFDKYGNVHIPFKKYLKPEDEYYYESNDYYYQKGNPDIFKSNYRIIRRNDRKIIGESIVYIRRGGGLPGPWHQTSFSCPEKINLGSSIFKNKEKQL